MLFIQNVLNSQGWKRRGWAALFGICAALALPPLYILPLLVPAFAGLFLLIHAATTRRQAFFDGWWWGLGHFTAGLYWMCISLYVEPEKFAWLTPFALFGVPSVAAIYIGLVALALYYLRTAFHISRASYQIVIFAALWVIAEYARAHLFSGFPWNLTGYVWAISALTLQLASVVGIYGLSWFTVILATMLALFVLKERPWPANIATHVMLVLMLAFGWWRLDAYPTQYTATKVRVVQANISQAEKMKLQSEITGFRRQVVLTQQSGLNTVQAVIWPESGVPFLMEPNSPLTNDLGKMLPKNTLLITGGMRGNGKTGNDWQAWNTLFVLDHRGHILSQYDKHHLVPFGEFIPLRHVLSLENITGGIGDFSRGAGPATMTLATLLPYSPLICYEAIFPDEATDGTGRAKWLLGITNDAWFGNSSGPYQHLAMARTRAVEQGLPLIRAAGTGISAAYDGLGRELARIPLGQAGIFDSLIPQSQKTVFAHYPCAAFLLILLLSAVLLAL